MLLFFFIFYIFCSISFSRIVKHAVNETYENSGHFDIMFVLFVWIAFLPSVISPVLMTLWLMAL